LILVRRARNKYSTLHRRQAATTIEGAVFDQPIGSWDTSNVTSMDNMFFQAVAFNQSLNTTTVGDPPYVAWNTGNVTNMQGMFHDATDFDSGISGWNTSNVTRMNTTFKAALAFDQNLAGWNVTKVNLTGSCLTSAAFTPVDKVVRSEAPSNLAAVG